MEALSKKRRRKLNAMGPIVEGLRELSVLFQPEGKKGRFAKELHVRGGVPEYQ